MPGLIRRMQMWGWISHRYHHHEVGELALVTVDLSSDLRMRRHTVI